MQPVNIHGDPVLKINGKGKRFDLPVETRALLSKVDANGVVNGKKYCTRGLERYMRCPNEREGMKFGAWDSVLLEQRLQRIEGTFCEESIARLYKYTTVKSVVDATHQARLDAKEVASFYRGSGGSYGIGIGSANAYGIGTHGRSYSHCGHGVVATASSISGSGSSTGGNSNATGAAAAAEGEETAVAAAAESSSHSWLIRRRATVA